MRQIILILLLLAVTLYYTYPQTKSESFYFSELKTNCDEFMKPALDWFKQNVKDPYEKGQISDKDYELYKSKFYDICVWMIAPKMISDEEDKISVEALFNKMTIETLPLMSALVRMWWLENKIGPENWSEEKFHSQQVEYLLEIEKCSSLAEL